MVQLGSMADGAFLSPRKKSPRAKERGLLLSGKKENWESQA